MEWDVCVRYWKRCNSTTTSCKPSANNYSIRNSASSRVLRSSETCTRKHFSFSLFFPVSSIYLLRFVFSLYLPQCLVIQWHSRWSPNHGVEVVWKYPKDFRRCQGTLLPSSCEVTYQNFGCFIFQICRVVCCRTWRTRCRRIWKRKSLNSSHCIAWLSIGHISTPWEGKWRGRPSCEMWSTRMYCVCSMKSLSLSVTAMRMVQLNFLFWSEILEDIFYVLLETWLKYFFLSTHCRRPSPASVLQRDGFQLHTAERDETTARYCKTVGIPHASRSEHLIRRVPFLLRHYIRSLPLNWIIFYKDTFKDQENT